MIDRGNVGDILVPVQTDISSILSNLQFFSDDVLVAFALELADFISDNNSLRVLVAGLEEMIDD